MPVVAVVAAGVPDLERFRRLAWWTSATTFGLILVGAATMASDSGLACRGWPLCHAGQLWPALVGGVVLEWGHRMGALVVTVVTLLAVRAGLRLPVGSGPWRRGSWAGLTLLALQIALGGLAIDTRLAPLVVVVHEGVGTAFLCLWVGLAVLAAERTRSPASTASRADPQTHT